MNTTSESTVLRLDDELPGGAMIKKPKVIDVRDGEFSLDQITEKELIKYGAILVRGFSFDEDDKSISVEGNSKVRLGSQFPHKDGGAYFDPQNGEAPVPKPHGMIALYVQKNENEVGKHEPYTFLGDSEQVVKGMMEYFAKSDTPRYQEIINSVLARIKGAKTVLSDIDNFRKAVRNVGIENIGDIEDLASIEIPTIYGTTETLNHIYKRLEQELSEHEVTLLIQYLEAKGLLFVHRWNPNETLFIDNTRMMHGRFDPFKLNTESTPLRRKIFEYQKDGSILPIG